MKAEIKKLLRPFFKWKPELQPPLPDLRKRVTKAIFWYKEAPAVVPVSRDLVRFWSGRRDVFWENLTNNLGGQLDKKLTKEQIENLQSELDEELSFWPQEPTTFKKEGVPIEEKLWRSLEDLWYGLSILELQTALRGEMRLNLWCTLFLAAGYCLAGDKNKNFQALFDLWLKGNPPAWFNRQGELIVLCRQPF